MKMRKENYKIKHKCLLGIFIIGMLIFSEPLYSQNNIIPSNLRKSLYKLYHYNPQFRSIIPCEVLLYIEVTFLGFIH